MYRCDCLMAGGDTRRHYSFPMAAYYPQSSQFPVTPWSVPAYHWSLMAALEHDSAPLLPLSRPPGSLWLLPEWLAINQPWQFRTDLTRMSNLCVTAFFDDAKCHVAWMYCSSSSHSSVVSRSCKFAFLAHWCSIRSILHADEWAEGNDA